MEKEEEDLIERSIEEDDIVQDAVDVTDNESNNDDEEDSVEEQDYEELAMELERQSLMDLNNYDLHVKVIEAWRKAGDFDRLSASRHRMRERFPLTEALWLPWLQDELFFCSRQGSEAASASRKLGVILPLFEAAVQDYLSPSIWLEYLDFAQRALGWSEFKAVCENALAACGLHPMEGIKIWRRVIELVSELEHQEDEAYSYVQELKRRLDKVKIFGKGNETSDEVLLALFAYEERLVEENFSFASYSAYLDFELSRFPYGKGQQKDAKHLTRFASVGRTRILFERAIKSFCLTSELWQRYLSFLHEQLPVPSVILSVHKRAIRNCPWDTSEWINCLLDCEDFSKFDLVDEVFELATQKIGLPTPSDYLAVSLTRCDIARRRIHANSKSSDGEDLSSQRSAIERIFNQCQSIVEAAFAAMVEDKKSVSITPSICEIPLYLALVLAKDLKQIEASHSQIESLLARHAQYPQLWIKAIEFHLTFPTTNDSKKNPITSLFKRALHAINDIEAIGSLIGPRFIAYEREYGTTLESFRDAKKRVENRLKELAERKASERKSKLESSKVLVKSAAAATTTPLPSCSIFISNLAFSATEKDLEDLFNEKLSSLSSPAVPVVSVKVVKNPKFKGKTHAIIKLSDPKLVQEAVKLDRIELLARPLFIQPYHEKPNNNNNNANSNNNKGKGVASDDTSSSSQRARTTLIVKNLDPSLPERQLEDFFFAHGGLKKIRRYPANRNNTNHEASSSATPLWKPFAYIEYVNEECAERALLKSNGFELTPGKKILVEFDNIDSGAVEKGRSSSALVGTFTSSSATMMKPVSVITRKKRVFISPTTSSNTASNNNNDVESPNKKLKTVNDEKETVASDSTKPPTPAVKGNDYFRNLFLSSTSK